MDLVEVGSGQIRSDRNGTLDQRIMDLIEVDSGSKTGTPVPWSRAIFYSKHAVHDIVQ